MQVALILFLSPPAQRKKTLLWVQSVKWASGSSRIVICTFFYSAVYISWRNQRKCWLIRRKRENKVKGRDICKDVLFLELVSILCFVAVQRVWLRKLGKSAFIISQCLHRHRMQEWLHICHILAFQALVNILDPFFKKKEKILFIFRQRGRGEEREGEKHQCVCAFCVPPTGDLVCNPGLCPEWELN